MATLSSPWVCTICSQPIADDDGHVDVVNNNPKLGPVGGYPAEATPDPREPQRDLDGTFVELSDHDAALLELEPANVEFKVTHRACDPDPDGAGYHFHIATARTLGQWGTWIMHLSRKSWMGRADILRMLAFFYSNRGIHYSSPGDAT